VDLSQPFAAVTPTLDGPVLAVLAGTTRPMSARDVARLVRRGSWSGVRKTLHRLVAQGIVHVEAAGTAQLFTLNRAHLAAPAVEVLASLRELLTERLRETIGAWPIQPQHASMFGSAARGDGDVESDIDLFVVRPRGTAAEDGEWRRQMDDLARDVLTWTGNHAGIAEVGAAEVAKVVRTAAGQAIRTEGIDLAGTPIRQLSRPSRVAS
jgi:predicted nucleotidyltransferase